jgi:DNA-binding PadR family transcriptional regulator
MVSPIHYYILVAIGDGRAHGYAIMQEIAERTGGAVQVLPGTLYSTIKRLVADGMIEECAPPPRERNADERRRYYRLTPRGKRAASEETDRLASLVRLARKKGFAPSR